MARKKEEKPIRTRLERLPLDQEAAADLMPIRVNNRLATVPDSERAADLFSRILRAVRAERAVREEKRNGRN
jgi:hypothetical protein